jgi:hypothetical protein
MAGEKSIYAIQRELAELRRHGDETRMGDRRELLQLRNELASTKKSLEAQGASCAPGMYQQAVRHVFCNEDGSGVPQAHVLKLQAQLCHSLHFNEVQLKQSIIVGRRCKHITEFFEQERDKLRVESGNSKRVLSNKVYEETASWQNELGELKSRYSAQKEQISRLRTLSKQRHELCEERLMNGAPVSPLHESLMRVMEGIHYKDLKHAVMPASLDRTITPPNLSESSLWKQLKNSSSSSRQRSKNQSMNGHGEYTKSLLWNDLKKDSENKKFAGMGKIKSLKPFKRSTAVHKSENNDNLMLSPTSKTIKALSAEVFGL